MAYIVAITSKDGQERTYSCGGTSDQEALIYAGKIVEANAAEFDQDASVNITKDGKTIGPSASVKDMTNRTV